MPIRTLAEAISHYGRDAYLLTVAKDGPHTGNVAVEVCAGGIICNIGASASRNINGNPNVSLFWPPTERGGYALIINGTATIEHQVTGAMTAEIAMTKLVLHRPGPNPGAADGLCASDCRRLTA